MAVRRKESGGESLAEFEQACIKLGIKLCNDIETGKSKDKHEDINAVCDILAVLKKE